MTTWKAIEMQAKTWSLSGQLQNFAEKIHGSGCDTLSAISELAGPNLGQMRLMMFNCSSGYTTDQSQKNHKNCKTDKFRLKQPVCGPS